MERLTPEFLLLGLLWYVVFLFSTVCHEAGHAYMASRLGDQTAYMGGQVSLNPAPHMQREPMGMIVMPWLSYLVGGWMMGWASIPVDPYWTLRNPRKASWVSLAGPLANFALVLLSGIAIRSGLAFGMFTLPKRISFESLIVGSTQATEGIATFLSLMFCLNLLLGLFNLVPVPPLDGYSVLGLFLPENTARKLEEFRFEYARFTILGLFLAWRIFDEIGFGVFWKCVFFLYTGVRG